MEKRNEKLDKADDIYNLILDSNSEGVIEKCKELIKMLEGS